MIPIPRSIARIPLMRGLFRVVLVGWQHLFHGRYMVENRLGIRLLLDQENAFDRQIFISGAPIAIAAARAWPKRVRRRIWFAARSGSTASSTSKASCW